MQRPCGPRKSAKTPNAYTRDELLVIAKNRQIKGYYKMRMDELCKVLFVPGYKASPLKVRLDPSRPCGPRKSAKTPNAYTRDELLVLARKKGIIGASKIKTELELLNEIIPVIRALPVQ